MKHTQTKGHTGHTTRKSTVKPTTKAKKEVKANDVLDKIYEDYLGVWHKRVELLTKVHELFVAKKDDDVKLCLDELVTDLNIEESYALWHCQGVDLVLRRIPDLFAAFDARKEGNELAEVQGKRNAFCHILNSIQEEVNEFIGRTS